MRRAKFDLIMVILISFLLTIPLISTQSQFANYTSTNESEDKSTNSDYNYSINYSVTPHIEIDAEVFPNKIYKADDPASPRSAAVRLNIHGRGDIIPEIDLRKPVDIVFVVDTTVTVAINNFAKVRAS